MNDVGLLASQVMGDTEMNDLLAGRSAVNYGSIFENVAAQEFLAHGFAPYYYATKGMGEVDYVLQFADGAVGAFEMKSGKDYARHSALSKLLACDNYTLNPVVVFCDGNVSQRGAVTYLPAYMCSLVRP